MKDKTDTNEHGSNENNMGRAAHNQNMLMQAHAYVRKAVSARKGISEEDSSVFNRVWTYMSTKQLSLF